MSKNEVIDIDLGYSGQAEELSSYLVEFDGDVKEAFDKWVNTMQNRARLLSRVYGLIFACNASNEVPCEIKDGKIKVTVPEIVAKRLTGE